MPAVLKMVNPAAIDIVRANYIPTLCFFVCVERVGTGFAVSDGPPADAPALGIVTDTSLKQVE